jgi:O-antigen ligase
MIAACVGIGIAVAQIPLAGIEPERRSLAISVVLLGVTAIVVARRAFAAALTLLLLLAFTGDRRELFGVVFDTTYLVLPLALVVIAMAADRVRSKHLPRPLALGPLWVGWLLIFAGTVVAAILAGRGQQWVWTWLAGGLVMGAVLALSTLVGPKQILVAWISVALVVAYGGIAQQFGLPGAPPQYRPSAFEVDRPDSFFEFTNALGTYLGVSCVFALALVLRRDVGGIRLFGLAGLALLAAALLATSSRGALGGALVGISGSLALTVWFSSGARDRKRAVVAIGAVMVGAVVAFLSAGSGITTRLASGKLGSSDALRASAMSTGWRIARTQILGVGPGEFQHAALNRLGTPTILVHPHNTLLTLWAERGVLGLLGGALMLLGPGLVLLRRVGLRRATPDQLLVSVGVPLTIFVQYLADYTWYEIGATLTFVASLQLSVTYALAPKSPVVTRGTVRQEPPSRTLPSRRGARAASLR